MNIISAKNLSAGYGNEPILNKVSFDIEQGEYVFLVGGNGSGKSTLIKTILGVIDPIAGNLEIYEKKFSHELIAKKFAYLPQYTKLERDFPITVMEVIELECGFGNDKCNMDASEHLGAFGAEGLMGRKLSKLSGGEFQKVMIARALVADPEILILDEPANNLDAKAEKELGILLRKLNKDQGKTIVVVTHDHAVLHDPDHKQKVLSIVDNQIIQQNAANFFHHHV